MCPFPIKNIAIISCSTATDICYNISSADHNITVDGEVYIRAILTIPETQYYTTKIIINYDNNHEQMFTSDTIRTSTNQTDSLIL